MLLDKEIHVFGRTGRSSRTTRTDSVNSYLETLSGQKGIESLSVSGIYWISQLGIRDCLKGGGGQHLNATLQ